MTTETKLFTQKVYIILIITSFIILGCKQTDNATPETELYTSSIEIVLDGKTYKEEQIDISLTDFGVQQGCIASKNYLKHYLNEMLRPTFSFQCIVTTFEDGLEFSKSKSGKFNVLDFNDIKKSCNLDLSVLFFFGTERLSLEPGASYEIVNIQKQKDNSQKNPVYLITGNFKCTFKNKKNQYFPVVGKFSRSIFSKIYY